MTRADYLAWGASARSVIGLADWLSRYKKSVRTASRLERDLSSQRAGPGGISRKRPYARRPGPGLARP
jgi:hypothetical protein